MGAKSREFFDSTDEIDITALQDGSCRIQTGARELILSFDAAYDLALRLAFFIQNQDVEGDQPSFPLH